MSTPKADIAELPQLAAKNTEIQKLIRTVNALANLEVDVNLDGRVLKGRIQFLDGSGKAVIVIG
jgi:hypothetical protein